MDTSSVPLAYAPIAPLSPRPTQPREIFIGENQRHQRAVRTRRKCVSSPDVLSLSLALSLFRFAASRPAFFRGLFPRKQSFRFSFRRPLFTVHIPKELEASSFQLNPIPIVIARLLSGAKIKLVHEGGRRCYRLLARALRNIFLNRTVSEASRGNRSRQLSPRRACWHNFFHLLHRRSQVHPSADRLPRVETAKGGGGEKDRNKRVRVRVAVRKRYTVPLEDGERAKEMQRLPRLGSETRRTRTRAREKKQ